MKLKTLLLAAAFVGGSFVAASAQSGMNQTPSGTQKDVTISTTTHCMDKASGQARLKSGQSGTTASGAVGVQDKSARSTGASSQTSANAAVKLSDC